MDWVLTRQSGARIHLLAFGTVGSQVGRCVCNVVAVARGAGRVVGGTLLEGVLKAEPVADFVDDDAAVGFGRESVPVEAAAVKGVFVAWVIDGEGAVLEFVSISCSLFFLCWESTYTSDVARHVLDDVEVES